jgi:hypothetical protein
MKLCMFFLPSEVFSLAIIIVFVRKVDQRIFVLTLTDEKPSVGPKPNSTIFLFQRNSVLVNHLTL